MYNRKKYSEKTNKGFAIASACFLCLLYVSDVQAQTNNSSSQKTLPGLKDWFLSTGNWEKGPQIYVREFGTGKDTVIMLHGGWGAEHSELVTAVSDLGTQFHFIFYDQRGSLRSPCPDSLITFDNHIDDLERLRKELKIEKINLVGHSMGAVLACAYAKKFPQHIRQLSLLAPMLLKQPIPSEDTTMAKQSFNEFQTFMDRPAVKQELDKFNLNRQSPPLSSTEETAKFRINAFGRRMLFDISKWPDIMGGRALFKGNVFELTARTYPASGWDYIQEFKTQNYPVNIMAADHDFLDYKNGLIKKWASENDRVQLIQIKNAGHIIWIDQPKEFSKQLAKQLER